MQYNGRHGGKGMKVIEANVNDESGPYDLSVVLWSSREIGRNRYYVYFCFGFVNPQKSKILRILLNGKHS